MERAGGLVDSWGGGEFCHIFPRVLAFIQSGADHAETSQNPQKIPSGLVLPACERYQLLGREVRESGGLHRPQQRAHALEIVHVADGSRS
jgi:hypothetical protein